MDDDDLVGSDLECAICLGLLCEPVEWPGACSHHFCRHCLLRLRTLAAFKCPMCRCPASSTPSTTVTLAQISRWPVSHERRARAKAAAPDQYRRCRRDHELKSALLLRGDSAKKGLFWTKVRSRMAGYSIMPGAQPRPTSTVRTPSSETARIPHDVRRSRVAPRACPLLVWDPIHAVTYLLRRPTGAPMYNRPPATRLSALFC